MTDNISAFSNMQLGKPIGTYKKTILGKLAVQILDPWTNGPTGMIMEGDPKKNEDGTLFDTWNDAQDTYFRRANKVHFERGTLIRIVRKEEDVEVSPNAISDDEIEGLLNSRFLKLQNRLNTFTTPAPAYRVLSMAKEMEKSEKIIRAIEARIAELQALELQRE